jgi:outer membrane autotransporter protein
VTNRLRTSVICTSLAILLCAGTGTATAQAPQVSAFDPDAPGWIVTPFLGIAFGGKLETSPATGGVSIGYGGRTFGFDGEIARMKGQQGRLEQFDTTVWMFGLNATYDFDTDRAFTPYGLAGIVFQRVSADFSNLVTIPEIEDSDTATSWNVGAGIKTSLTERAGIRIDLRYISGRGDLAPDFVRLYFGFMWRLTPR